MHLGGLLSAQKAKVVLGYRLLRLLRFFSYSYVDIQGIQGDKQSITIT